jgi:hypothetical protein
MPHMPRVFAYRYTRARVRVAIIPNSCGIRGMCGVAAGSRLDRKQRACVIDVCMARPDSKIRQQLRKGHKETPTMLKSKPKLRATPKPKPLPPSGSYQALSKKMPPDTRYKGESHPASNLEERYEEHMARQRAAGAVTEAGKR